MRFPLPHRLESTEIRFAFKTETYNATLLSTYSQASFTKKMDVLGPIHPDGMRVDFVKGFLVIIVMLNGHVVVSYFTLIIK